MEGFAKWVQDELTATPPPRSVRLRDFGDAWKEWAWVLFFLGYAVFLGYFFVEKTIMALAPDYGLAVSAKIKGHSIGGSKSGRNYFLHVAFTDPHGNPQVSEMCAGRPFYDANPDGGSVSIKYIDGFPQWAVWDGDGADLYDICGMGLLGLLALFFVFIPVNLLYREYKIFKNGVFVEGTVTDAHDKANGRNPLEIITVQYSVDGVPYEKVVKRGVASGDLEKDAAVVVIPGHPGKTGVYFSNSNKTIFKVGVPDSYYQT